MSAIIKLKKGDRIPNTRLCYLEEVKRLNPKRRHAKFICDCGKTIETDLNWVRFGNITSCGCFKTEELIKKNIKHGNAFRNSASGAYRSWQALNQRAGISKNYEHVKVDECWTGENGFINFLRDMGERPKGYSIERIDNNKGYQPDNCRWATRTEQARNTSNNVNVTIGNTTQCIAAWCDEKNINYSLVKQRRQKGMSLIDSIITPVDASKQNNKYKNSNLEQVMSRNLPFLDLPNENNSYYDTSFRYTLHKDLYLVFGSNLRGVHGAGGARVAVMEYGAVYGIGIGLQGHSYAIPTKDKNLNILPLNIIKEHILNFVKFTNETDYKFFITAVGTGLAKYKHADIAPYFKGVRNSWLPEQWRDYV